MYDANRPAILKWNVVGLGVDGNRYVRVRYCGDEMLSIHAVSATVLNPDLPVAIHTQSHHIPFQDCWSVSVIHKLPDSTPDHIHHLSTPVVIILASGSEVCGFDPGQGRWIFSQHKSPEYDFLRKGSKAVGPVS